MDESLNSLGVEQFRQVLGEHLGLHFPDDKLPWLCDVLKTRLRKTGSPSISRYLDGCGRPEEVAQLAPLLSVGETYFLRHREQFDALAALSAQKAKRGARRLRLLSAGCSTGEEAYSMAIVLGESASVAALEVTILGIDLNLASVERARLGQYTAWSMRDTPASVQARYFRQAGGSFFVDPSLKELVRFEQYNLAEPQAPAGPYDFIFCRNVLMYFTRDAALAVIGRFAEALAPGGFLFLGHAETLRGLSHDFILHHEYGTFFYERKGTLNALCSAPSKRLELPSRIFDLPPPMDTSWFTAITRSTQRVEALTEAKTVRANGAIPVDAKPEFASRLAVLELLKQERLVEARELLTRIEHADSESLLLRAVILMMSGEIEAAERACAELLTADDLNASAHYVLALCREHAGDMTRAVDHQQIACYLDPGFALPHLRLGILARRTGNAVTAQRELKVARDLLPAELGERIVLFGGGFGRTTLLELCHRELALCGGNA